MIASPRAPRVEPRQLSVAAERVLLGALPLLLSGFMLSLVLRQHNFALDFNAWFRPAGERVLHGVSPYSLPTAQAFDYPALGALLFVPFALLPHAVAQWSFAAMVFASVPAALWVLEVRDWRLYAAVMMWQPVIVGWEFANVSLPLVLGVAVAWRHRERAALTGVLVAVLISVKIFLLPLALWLIATRRWRATAWMLGAGIVLGALSWAVLGFDQIPVYLRLLRAFAPSAERRGYSVISLALHLGADHAVAFAIGLGLAGAVIAAALAMRGPARDRHLLSAVLLASLLASPLVDVHYLALLVVPLAIARPTFSAVWALPIMMLVLPADHPTSGQQAFGLVVFTLVAAAFARPGPRSAGPAGPAVQPASSTIA